MLTWFLLHFIYKSVTFLCWLGAALPYDPETEEFDGK